MNAWRKVLAGAGLVLGLVSGVAAQTVIDEWSNAKFPDAPALKPAKIDPRETALLVMDFTVQTCTPDRRKRCADHDGQERPITAHVQDVEQRVERVEVEQELGDRQRLGEPVVEPASGRHG